jgi:hypothetical protein
MIRRWLEDGWETVRRELENQRIIGRKKEEKTVINITVKMSN